MSDTTQASKHSKELTENRRRNNIFGETDYIIKKFLSIGGTAAFRSPDDTILYGRTGTQVCIFDILCTRPDTHTRPYIYADEKTKQVKFYHADGKKMTWLQ